jgi:hypothetical protein
MQQIDWRNALHTAKKPKNYASAMLLALAFCVGLGVYAFRGVIWPQPHAVVTPPAVAASTFRHPLTGALSDTEVAKPQVQAVMIDHSIDAWPQSGVDKAFLVIEAPVEASIPRLEAFFYEGQNVLKIGPVRSARPYFVDFANEFGAEYAHVGGSDEALALIASSGTFDLNQFSHGDDYWRSTDRQAPHNAYTSTDLLDKALKAPAVHLPTPSYGTWTFKDPATDVSQGPGVTVDFSAPQYKAIWTHDAATNTYTRTQDGAKYVMQDGGKIAATNVAVMVSDVSIVDAVGRKHIRTTGEGEAWVFQDGKAIHGTWKKPSVTDRLRFYDQDGKEIAMNAGNTWIEVIGDAKSVTINQPK